MAELTAREKQGWIGNSKWYLQRNFREDASNLAGAIHHGVVQEPISSGVMQDMLGILIGLYLLIGTFFVAYTYLEGITSTEGGTFLRIVGLLVCLVWPAVLAAVVIEVLRSRRLSTIQPVGKPTSI